MKLEWNPQIRNQVNTERAREAPLPIEEPLPHLFRPQHLPKDGDLTKGEGWRPSVGRLCRRSPGRETGPHRGQRVTKPALMDEGVNGVLLESRRVEECHSRAYMKSCFSYSSQDSFSTCCKVYN